MKTSTQIRPAARVILMENLTKYNSDNNSKESLFSYYLMNKEGDPSLMSWLFHNADNLGDFGQGMTPDQIETLEAFEKEIED